MAKLTVKNVGPIREAEFEVKKHTVFIGPQGSGKSTLAKLIAICSDTDILPLPESLEDKIVSNYGLVNYIVKPEFKGLNPTKSYIFYQSELYRVGFNENGFGLLLQDESQRILKEEMIELLPDYFLEDFDTLSTWSKNESYSRISPNRIPTIRFYEKFLLYQILQYSSLYIPSERNLTATLDKAIWSLVYSDINLPKMITQFGRYFEEARNTYNQFNIQFLQLNYVRKDGQDFIEYQPGQFIKLSESASGYQSIIPLLLVIEHQRRQSRRRFIIEEPELNLYPTAQKDLIYALMSGLNPDIEYQDAEWVITTHSPYVLSSFNTLMLAYKVANRNNKELWAEVEKIIPARCWINPDEFAAYYVEKGTVHSIISEKTGLIADNELDDVSDDLGDEQDKLFALSRSVSRA